MSVYGEFLRNKQRQLKPMGFEASGDLCESLHEWQADVVRWALKRGRAALFEECGLGKTLQQLEWARCVHEHTELPVVVHCPVGVRQQTKREASKFAIRCPVEVVDRPAHIVDGINLVNYEKLHHFEEQRWGGVVLDESSILKSFTGKIKRSLIDRYADAPYRLACTATPAPNDYMELGNHADFLGVMPSNEMLSRWFINDTMKAGGYRLKTHGAGDFWRWVSTWATCLSQPSDIGGCDEGYHLPELIEREHVVEVSEASVPAGQLFATSGISATTIHKSKRHSTQERSAKVAELVMSEPGESWIIWCDTNYESDALVKSIPQSVQIRGSDSDSVKEAKLLAFANGDCMRFVSKPSLSGFGMNWQHCSRVAFVGLSYSFEQYYQAVRRTWRFGQTRSVHVHIVVTDAEYAANKAVQKKQAQFAVMQTAMADAMQNAIGTDTTELEREVYDAKQPMEIPQWT